ncbi:hypothetical protein V8J88_24660 [Massilia sp. W12]|uniref:hypothetical protein n=1 Tax=Massilia sp. W12 TaxID=3126507 RepID=UPI0030D46B83
MLIRIENDELLEYPDELGALVLADPRDGDMPDFPLDIVNCLLHDTLVRLFDASYTLQQNIAKAEAYCAKWGQPSPSNLAKARAMIADYNANIPPESIGFVDKDLMNYLYFSQHPAESMVQAIAIQQAPDSSCQAPMNKGK